MTDRSIRPPLIGARRRPRDRAVRPSMPAQPAPRREPGERSIALGTWLARLGVVGVVAGLAAFVALSAAWQPDGRWSDPRAPIVAWAVFMVSMVVVAAGAYTRERGRRRRGW